MSTIGAIAGSAAAAVTRRNVSATPARIASMSASLTNAGPGQGPAEGTDRIIGGPALDLLFRAVDVGVRRRMAGAAIALDVEERRAVAGDKQRPLASDGVGDGERIGAVDRLGVHRLHVDRRADARQTVPAHGLADGLAAHGVEVVVEEEEHRQAARPVVPQRPVLRHGGEIHRLPDRAAAGRAVADVGDGDAVFAEELLGERGAGRDSGRAADDGVVGIGAEGREEGVHRAAHAAVEAVRAHEDFRQQAEQQKGLGDSGFGLSADMSLDGIQKRPASITLHHAHEFGPWQLVDRRKSLGDEFAVAAMAAEDMVAGLERERRADRRAFLADREMRRPLVVVGDARIGAGRLQDGQHGLELADDHHVTERIDEGGVAAGQPLLRDRRPISVDGNFWKSQFRRAMQDVGIDEKSLGHGGSWGAQAWRQIAARPLFCHGPTLVKHICSFCKSNVPTIWRTGKSDPSGARLANRRSRFYKDGHERNHVPEKPGGAG